MGCEHIERKATRRTIAGGAVIVSLQCQRCGSGRAAKISEYKINELPEFDESISERYRAEINSEWEKDKQIIGENRAALSREWFEKYNLYLKSDHWRMVRQKVLERDRICQLCFKNFAAVAHHLSYATYSKSGVSFPQECVGVCNGCHQKLHPEKELNGD